MLTDGCGRAHPVIKNIIQNTLQAVWKSGNWRKGDAGYGREKTNSSFITYWPHLVRRRRKMKKVAVWKTSGVQIIIKLKAVTNGNTQAFLLDSFNMEIVQLGDFSVRSLCNTFGITSLQTLPGNISLSYMPTSFRWRPSKPKSWKQIRRLLPSTWALNHYVVPGWKIKPRFPGLQSTSLFLGLNEPTFITHWTVQQRVLFFPNVFVL